MAVYDLAPANVRSLIDAFWCSEGWKRPAELPSGEELSHAIDAGIMFGLPRSLSHDDWIAAAKDSVDGIPREEIEDAFVASLLNRRLDLRSALGSYVVARHLPAHRYAPGLLRCSFCGLPEWLEQDLNVLNFERFKWGGVRRDDIAYVAFDLEQFRRAPRTTVTGEAVQIGRDLLSALRRAGSSETATTCAASMRMIRGNKEERAALLDILGVAGVLETAEHRGHREAFVPMKWRQEPNRKFIDRAYPASWWRGTDGVNEAAVRELLPSLA